MKKKYLIFITAFCELFLFTSFVFAEVEWELNVKVNLLFAENRITIGQKNGANDGFDGRYDVIAFLSGDIEAFILSDSGKKNWKDIKRTCDTSSDCEKKWILVVNSSVENGEIRLTWKKEKIPPMISLKIKDIQTGDIKDMRTSTEIIYKNSGSREFIISGQKI